MDEKFSAQSLMEILETISANRAHFGHIPKDGYPRDLLLSAHAKGMQAWNKCKIPWERKDTLIDAIEKVLGEFECDKMKERADECRDTP